MRQLTGQRTATMRARCFESERRALEDLAKREGRSVSDVLRELVRDRAKRVGLWPTEGTPQRQEQAA